jgi:putative thioredoxin
MEQIIGQTAPNTGSQDWIIEGSDATFKEDVLDASQDLPVIVDFWAPWCGPCKQLGPALEKAISAARGKARLVKINIDQNPAIAGQLRVQSIPAVFAFIGGRPVDGFAGALPESQIKDFIDRMVEAGGGADDPVDEALEQAQAMMDAENYAAAASLYGQVLQHVPENIVVAARLASAYIKLGELDAAKEVLGAIPPDKAGDPDVISAQAALDLAVKAAALEGELGALESAIQQDPNDHQARSDLADALAAMGRTEEAVDHLLYIVETDRAWNEDAGRLHLLKIFDALGPTDPSVLYGRRRLSSLLFS